MKLLSQIFDFMFAPAGAFDPSSSLYNAANDTSITRNFHGPSINPATGLPMIDNGDGIGGITGIDVGGNFFGVEAQHHDYFSASTDSVFSNACTPMFDHHTAAFDCSSPFETGMPSTDFGCKFD